MRVSALVVLVAGCVGSVALMLRAGRASPQHVVMLLMSIWVAAPFAMLFAADRRSIQWRRAARYTLYGLMFALAPISLMIYANDQTLRPAHVSAAFLFVLVPPLSVLVIAISLGIAMLTSRAD